MKFREINGVSTLLNYEDIAELRRLVENMPAGSWYVEIGCFEGGSVCCVADIIKRRLLNAICCDLFDLSPSEDPNIKEWVPRMGEEFTENTRNAGICPLAIKGTSKDVADMMERGKIKAALVFIDGDHSYEWVKKDIENLWPYMQQGGVMSGHDYGGSHEGVKKAVDEFFGTKTFCQENTQVWSVRA